MEIKKLLEQIRSGEVSIEEAADRIEKLPYEDLNFAKLDHHRAVRTGFPEVVFCQGKTAGQIAEICRHFLEYDKCVLGTRATPEQYEQVKKQVPQVQYNEMARTISVSPSTPEYTGLVAVCTGGTADLPVAEEAAVTAEFFGARVERFYDVGVAGIHRLLSNTRSIEKANAIVAVAGMEGALPGVLAGLVDKPVIAVPTSVGYGASFDGLAPLLTMLNSCAEGVTVVNIDNGFGAGYSAAQINRLIEKAKDGK